MPNKITTKGLVATTPRHIITAEGLAITSFRLAEYDSSNDNSTNWYTVSTFGQLAVNTASSISKGDRIIAQGNLNIRDWDNGERSGTSVEIEADALGHDLTYGLSEFQRNVIVPETKSDHKCSCGKCDR